MPQSDPPVSPPGAPPGFDERQYTTFRQGQVNRLQLLLPLSFTQEEEAALAREAQDQQSAYESAQREVALQEQLRLDYERKIKKKLALEAQELEEQEETCKKALHEAQPKVSTDTGTEVPKPLRSAVGDLDIAAERKFLEYEARSGEQLHRRTFAQVLRAKHSGIGQLMKPVLAWDEVLKLIHRKGATPDRDAIKRDRELFLRIRNEWPHGMRTVGYPLRDHQAVLADLNRIAEQLPHFGQVLQHVREHLVLSFERRQPMHIPPVLLLGEPGIGKTHFTHELAKALRLPVHRHSFDASVTGSALMGSDRHWANTNFGLVFEALVLGRSASPVVLLDEIDKATSTSERSNALGPLHSLLEPLSAKAVTDISVLLTVDASHIVWISTANVRKNIPESICSRMHEFLIEGPRGEQAIQAAYAVARAVHDRMGSERFDPPAPKVIRLLAHLSARELIKALETGYARALNGGSRTLQRHHLPAELLEEDTADDSAGSGPKSTRNPGDPDLPPQGGYLH